MELLAQERILCDEFCLAAREVGEYASNQRIGVWAEQTTEVCLYQLGPRAKEVEEKLSEGDRSVACHPLKSSQRLPASVTPTVGFQKCSTDDLGSHHRDGYADERRYLDSKKCGP